MNTRTTQKWIATGHVVATPTVRRTGRNKSVCNFVLAVERSYPGPDGEKTEIDEFPITCWGEEAERQGSYLVAGSMIFLEGYVKNRVWTDSTNTVHHGFEVIPEKIVWLTPVTTAIAPEEEAEVVPW